MLRLLLALLLAGAAHALPEQTVPGTDGQVILRRTSEGNQALMVSRRAILSDFGLEALPLPRIAGQRAVLIRRWSGGAYCCFRLAILVESRAGWILAGQMDVGTGGALQPVPEGAGLWLPDGGFDFWDMAASQGTGLRPPIAWRLRHGRLMPDAELMRRPVAEALGESCTRLGQAFDEGRLPHFSTPEQAMAGLPAGEWGQSPQGRRSWRPEAEFARRALCLLHMGHGEAALRLLDAWPEDRPGRPETLAQLRARLLCASPALAALRVLNGANHPWLSGTCGEAERAAMTALSDLH